MSTGVWFDTCGVARYATDDARSLEVSAGQVRGVMSLLFEYRDPVEQPTDVIACEFRIADRAGRLWTTTSRFTTELFVTHLFDFARDGVMDLFRLPPTRRRYRDPCEQHTLKSYQDAFQNHLLLADARFFSDDRGYRHLVVARRLVRIKFKYMHLHLDIAGSGENSFADWVSVRIANHCFWDEERDVPLGPLAFDFRCVHFLRNNTAVWDADEKRWRDHPFPRPLVFSPMDGGGTPQDNVRVVESLNG